MGTDVGMSVFRVCREVVVSGAMSELPKNYGTVRARLIFTVTVVGCLTLAVHLRKETAGFNDFTGESILRAFKDFWLSVFAMGLLAYPVYKGMQWVFQPRSFFNDEEWETLRKAKDPELAEATALQRNAVARHARRLSSEVALLRLLAGLAYVIGIALCVVAVVAGPTFAYLLSNAHPQHWQYMLGGSALALIALAAGTALLRHDTKIQQQIGAAKRELHYFQRVETGLDCAFTLQRLGESPYRTGLERIVQHLLAPPPSLEIPAVKEGNSADMAQQDKGTDKGGKSDANAEELAADLIKLASKYIKS